MLFRQIKNEKGITLVELLAALGLLGVLIVLSSTLIIQLMGNEEQTGSNISLSQNTNILINELRNQYMNQSNDINEFDVCFQDIDGITIEQVIINNDNKESKETLNVTDGCIKDMKKQEVLPIKITTTNDLGQDLTLETALRSNNKYVVEVKNENEEYEFTEDGKFAECTYNKNTRFKNPNNNQKVMFKHNKCENNTFVVNGSAWIDGNIEVKNKVRLKVTKNLYISEDVSIVGKGGNADAGSMCVGGEMYFPDGKSERDYDIDFECNKT
ncbi:prepilin-type N-terminal cleavage/methylation domain-containing protein [Virgibacillus doumboii]|uniref:prepilin-type N-terminal cleavage/methylation domain-containing protein n=1 Tax=Virgibacillus doumboii TaxID=2697503 RepID=UPI0013E050F3|nr:prepilin-type N-terminal cleavage/methylation domain-containing protein [Virgibacillus doumboii]